MEAIFIFKLNLIRKFQPYSEKFWVQSRKRLDKIIFVCTPGFCTGEAYILKQHSKLILF